METTDLMLKKMVVWVDGPISSSILLMVGSRTGQYSNDFKVRADLPGADGSDRKAFCEARDKLFADNCRPGVGFIIEPKFRESFDRRRLFRLLRTIELTVAEVRKEGLK